MTSWNTYTLYVEMLSFCRALLNFARLEPIRTIETRTIILPASGMSISRSTGSLLLCIMRCGGSGRSAALSRKNRQVWADAFGNLRSISKAISLEERDEYWHRSEVYRKWLLERVFDAESKSVVTIMIFPIEAGKPNYREAELP